MSARKATNGNQKPHKIKPSISDPSDANRGKSIESHQSSENAEQHSESHPSIDKKYWLFQKENQPIIANVISFCMVLATAALVAYTVGIFEKTADAAKATKEAADAAKKSADLQAQAFGIEKKWKTQSDKYDALKLGRDTVFINKQKEGIDSQISAIKNNQIQFEISHSPYISVVGFERNPADSLLIVIKNLGAQVAYLEEVICNVKASTMEDASSKYKTFLDLSKWLGVVRNPYNSQIILPPGEAAFKSIKTLKTVSDADMGLVMQRKKFLFIHVVIDYFNTTNRKFMKYEYITVWNPVDNILANSYFSYEALKKYPD